MEDRLEKFVIGHRADFDLFEPSADVWNNIRKRKKNARVIQFEWKNILWKAAAVVVIFMASYAVQEYIHQKDNAQMASADSQKQEIVIPELLEAEFYYTNQVNEKLNEIQGQIGAYPDLKEQMNTDIAQLDSICIELKKDLRDNIDNQEVIDAMIQNYRLKLQILEELMNQLQRTNKTKSNKHNKNENKQYKL
jgi:hypothetical protein